MTDTGRNWIKAAKRLYDITTYSIRTETIMTANTLSQLRPSVWLWIECSGYSSFYHTTSAFIHSNTFHYILLIGFTLGWEVTPLQETETRPVAYDLALIITMTRMTEDLRNGEVWKMREDAAKLRGVIPLVLQRYFTSLQFKDHFNDIKLIVPPSTFIITPLKFRQ